VNAFPVALLNIKVIYYRAGVKCLPTVCKALNAVPSTSKKKKFAVDAKSLILFTYSQSHPELQQG
jgi:hypothetical protein